MLRSVLLAVTLLLAAGCGVLPVTTADTARLRPGQLGAPINQDVAAVHLAQWAFADLGRLRGRPVEAARASAAMDYIAGELNTSPRWSNISALTQLQLLQGRREVRAALGVAPDTPSQVVVDRLAATANALQNNDQAAALRDLGPPAFTAPPRAVLARLNDMPYLKMANVSTMHAANELFQPSDEDWR